MNAVTQPAGELVDDTSSFFAPMSSDLVDSLIGEYGAMRSRIVDLAEAMNGERHAGALHHFIEGNLRDERTAVPHQIGRLFDLNGALGHLNGAYWNRALKMTDVLDYMPQKRRDEWSEQIRNPLGREKTRHSNEGALPPLPEFEESTVRSTLAGLMHNRAVFFAERVDGIFRSLSREHVTNCPEGFNKRMILLRAISHYDTVDHSTAGVINDLRCVIAKFMGRDEPQHYVSSDTIARIRKVNGQWYSVDGGALRIRIYNGVGTAHLEVHPDMAWRLNGVLASMYPTAIPEKFRSKPARTRKIKDFELMDRPIPFRVINLLASMRPANRAVENPGFRESKFRAITNTRRLDNGDHDKHAVAEVDRILSAVGAVRDGDHWVFDYEPQGVLDEIICSGCIPDQKSYQYYPTPEDLAETAVSFAEIGPDHDCLEPSAGTGSIASLMLGGKSICCIEISPLHCRVLEAKGLKPLTKDFLEWGSPTGFDRIVMNPPFDQGRWPAHLEAAAKMLRPGGRLVAILPSGAKNRKPLPGMTCEWHGPYDNQFTGASVSVVILVATA